jgi:hypothetical protein
MAAVTKDATQQGDILINPKGYDYVIRGRATVNILRHGGVIIDAAAAADPRWDCQVKAAVTNTTILGIALHDALAGETIEFVTQAELCGLSGMTPGAVLSITAGVIDTTAPPAGATYLLTALNPTTVYFRA